MKTFFNRLLIPFFILIGAISTSHLSLAQTVPPLPTSWRGPTLPPPQGNRPGLIWNTHNLTTQQKEASINLEGSGAFGQDLTVLGKSNLKATDVTGNLTVSSGTLTVNGPVNFNYNTLRIDSAMGKVGINIARPEYTLDVNGQFYTRELCLPSLVVGAKPVCKVSWSDVTSSSTPTLQQVTDAGSTTNKSLAIADLTLKNRETNNSGIISVGTDDVDSTLTLKHPFPGLGVRLSTLGLALGGNTPDPNWSLSAPSAVIKGSSLGTTIKDGVIITDSNLTLGAATTSTPTLKLPNSLGAIEVGTPTSTASTLQLKSPVATVPASLDASGKLIGRSAVCIGDPTVSANCKTSWSQVSGVTGNFVRLSPPAPDSGNINITGGVTAGNDFYGPGLNIAGNASVRDNLTISAGRFDFGPETPTIRLGLTDTDTDSRTLTITHRNSTKRANLKVNGDIIPLGAINFGSTAPSSDNVNIKDIYYQTSTGTDRYLRQLAKDPATNRWSIEDVIPTSRNFTWGVYDANTNNPPTLQSQVVRRMTLTGEGDLTVAGKVKGNQGLCMGTDCRTSWPSGGEQNLLQVLQKGADASGFTGAVHLGASATARYLEASTNLNAPRGYIGNLDSGTFTATTVTTTGKITAGTSVWTDQVDTGVVNTNSVNTRKLVMGAPFAGIIYYPKAEVSNSAYTKCITASGVTSSDVVIATAKNTNNPQYPQISVMAWANAGQLCFRAYNFEGSSYDIPINYLVVTASSLGAVSTP